MTGMRRPTCSARGVVVTLLCLVASGLGCGRAPRPGPPTDLPTTMPSQEEAQRVREGAGEAITIPSAKVQASPAVPAEMPDLRSSYRVQVFATADSVLAAGRAAEVQELFDERVSVDLEESLYKVRIGDCASREVAEEVRRKALGLGLAGAFVVEVAVRAR